MPEYLEYLGNEKHEVESNGIRRYKKPLIFSDYRRWKADKFWEFTNETKLIEYTNRSGKGWVTLKGLVGPTSEQTFYSCENISSFEQEIASKGIGREPIYPELYGKQN